MKKKDLKLELESANSLISAMRTELEDYKEAYKQVVEENINLVNKMDTCFVEKLVNKVKEVNPLDVIDSLSIKSLVELDESGVVYELDGVALLSELRAEFKEIRQEKGLE